MITHRINRVYISPPNLPIIPLIVPRLVMLFYNLLHSLDTFAGVRVVFGHMFEF